MGEIGKWCVDENCPGSKIQNENFMVEQTLNEKSRMRIVKYICSSRPFSTWMVKNILEWYKIWPVWRKKNFSLCSIQQSGETDISNLAHACSRGFREDNLANVPKPFLTKTSKPPVPDPGFSQPRDRVGVRRRQWRQPRVRRRGGGLRRIKGWNPAAQERCQGVSFLNYFKSWCIPIKEY